MTQTCSTSSCCFPLPGRTPAQARHAFLEPLHRSLSCVTAARLLARTGRPGEVETLALSEDPLRLRSATAGSLRFMLAHRFRLVEDVPSAWHVSTLAYDYRLSDGDGRELISWHWHPAPLPGPEFPHLHVASGPGGRHAHIPTGRVSIESVLRFLLNDLGVPARREHAHDWDQILNEAERAFAEHRRWHARGPGEE